VRLRQPLRVAAPNSPIARALDTLAERVLLSPIEAEAA
jgi:MinD-like ATPase involved in chromosome partitioning or flagellar assembly